MDIISSSFEAYRTWTETLEPRFSVGLVRLALLYAIPVIFCGIGIKAGTVPKANSAMAFLGLFVALAFPIDPHRWDSRVNVWIIPLAVLSLMIIPRSLAAYLVRDAYYQKTLSAAFYIISGVLVILNALLPHANY